MQGLEGDTWAVRLEGGCYGLRGRQSPRSPLAQAGLSGCWDAMGDVLVSLLCREQRSGLWGRVLEIR